MSRTLKFNSDAFEAIHSSVAGMYRAGTIDKATMRPFDHACLQALEHGEVKEDARGIHVTQPIFDGMASRMQSKLV